MTGHEEFRAYMKAAGRTSNHPGEPHFSETQMIAYCRGEMAESDRESVRTHLIDCEQCIALFRSARDFLDPAQPGEEKISANETNAAWQSLSQVLQIPSSTKDGAAVVAPDFQRRSARKLFSRATLAWAAIVLLAIGLLVWQTWRFSRERESLRQAQESVAQSETRQRDLEQRLAQLEQTNTELKSEREQRLAAEAERDQLLAQLETSQQVPQYIPVFSFTLSSERGAEDDLRLRLPRTATAARLRLLINKPFQFPRYAIELVDSDGKLVQKVSGLRPAGDESALSFRVQRTTLSAGKYRLRLFGLEGTTQKQLGDYGLSVVTDR